MDVLTGVNVEQPTSYSSGTDRSMHALRNVLLKGCKCVCMYAPTCVCAHICLRYIILFKFMCEGEMEEGNKQNEIVCASVIW